MGIQVSIHWWLCDSHLGCAGANHGLLGNIPASIINSLNRMTANFIWAGHKEQKKSFNKTCDASLTKTNGRLGHNGLKFVPKSSTL